ncbi:hypothetical protein [Maritalea sp.]|uniref:hypothetical protein n=1 Tax=Maritalea sp. TaxID=2003361 RepID=UPI003EF4A203
MKNIVLVTVTLLFTLGNANAHSGHTEIVDGHAHTLVDLALMGLAPVALGLAVIGLVLVVRGRKS